MPVRPVRRVDRTHSRAAGRAPPPPPLSPLLPLTFPPRGVVPDVVRAVARLGLTVMTSSLIATHPPCSHIPAPTARPAVDVPVLVEPLGHHGHLRPAAGADLGPRSGAGHRRPPERAQSSVSKCSTFTSSVRGSSSSLIVARCPIRTGPCTARRPAARRTRLLYSATTTTPPSSTLICRAGIAGLPHDPPAAVSHHGGRLSRCWTSRCSAPRAGGHLGLRHPARPGSPRASARPSPPGRPRWWRSADPSGRTPAVTQ